MSLLYFFLFGMAGALIKDIVKDGSIQLPRVEDRKLYLGFVGSALVGGSVGALIDGSFTIAFLSGYVGYSIIENLLAKKLIVK